VRSRCDALAPGLPAYDSAAALVAGGGVDALVLATPAASHLADATIAAEAGLPVLVEKPPAPDVAQAASLTRLEPAPRIGFNRRYEPGLRRLRARIPSDEQLDLALTLHHSGGWRSHTVSDDALLSVGSHLIDLARWLADCEVERVRASHLDDGLASLELVLDRGRARISCASDRPHRDRVEIRTASGPAVGQYIGHGLVRRGWRRLARPGAARGLVHLLVLEIEAFASAARGGPAPSLATAADGLAVMLAIEAGRRSAESGGSWVGTGPGLH
jgi:predicted dehydrogenase